MKYLFFFMLLVLVFGCAESSTKENESKKNNSNDSTDESIEFGQKTSMEIIKVFDAGERIKGEKIEARFEVENTGRYPLVFGEIKGSCSCTVAEKPEAPVLPGKKGVIKAVVDTEKFDSGYKLNKIVTVMANTVPKNIVELKIIGTIK
ncbi:DUF1573 domain-containing protein [Crocinitomicaceae bacterium]|nr:DUF1573 domain-containing protein [Crocinitomicaceae bacterium]